MSDTMHELHIPVMPGEVVRYLDCRGGGVYVDATLGDGGHAAAICRRLSPAGRLIGIDWDEAALQRAAARLAEFACRVELVHRSYTELESVLAELDCPRVDGILLDLGVSTLQVMDAARGFSFHREEALDMRMDRRLPLRAADLVNSLPAGELARLIYRFGEERWAGRIASGIVSFREKNGPVQTAGQLVEIIKEAVPAASRRKGGHPARRTFQALRIAVNRELENIASVLPQAARCLLPEGRLCVIAYHSLEDRIVKRFLKEQSRRCNCPPAIPCSCGGEGELELLTAKAVRPAAAEINRNPRSRSARLRAAKFKGVLKEKAGA
jgi:16S rRNA (cytosine1402-N4)-methyltransferase